jgi:hypothetical protein
MSHYRLRALKHFYPHQGSLRQQKSGINGARYKKLCTDVPHKISQKEMCDIIYSGGLSMKKGSMQNGKY